ncbi:unnamed protein product, partial [Didymodactylos carnosus]
MVNYAALESILGYNFNEISLLQQALTTQSAINERRTDAHQRSYQTLEFLGDAVLKSVIARLLYDHNNYQTERELHDGITSYIGNRTKLCQIGRESMNLEQFIIRGRGVKEITNDMYADHVEAILGAISLDSPDDLAVFKVVSRLWNLPQRRQRSSPRGQL